MNNILPQKILIVDDDERNVRLMEAILKVEGYAIRLAFSGEEALKSIEEEPPDLILLDVMMPGMSGFDVAGKLKLNPETKTIPIIMVTALHDRNSRLLALEHGAEEFLSKPVDRAELWVRVRNLLRLKEYQNFLADHNRILEEQVAQRTAQLREAYRETIYTMTRAAEYKDEETSAHIRRVSYYSRTLAERLGMDALSQDQIFHASPMHDVGKIAIPDSIMLKPGGLNAEEWAVMREHTVLGHRILSKGKSDYLKMGAEIALNHHERWDGGGYPNGRKGEEIPLPARIMAICDVYDALRSKRPYKEPFEHARAVEIITKGDGRTAPGHFDPAVLAAFVAAANEFMQIYEQHADA